MPRGGKTWDMKWICRDGITPEIFAGKQFVFHHLINKRWGSTLRKSHQMKKTRKAKENEEIRKIDTPEQKKTNR